MKTKPRDHDIRIGDIVTKRSFDGTETTGRVTHINKKVSVKYDNGHKLVEFKDLITIIDEAANHE